MHAAANSARDALAKLCTLPLLAGTQHRLSVRRTRPVAGAIDIVARCELLLRQRRISEIVAPTGRVTGSTVEAATMFALQHDELVADRRLYPKLVKFRATGFDLAAVLGSGR